MKSQLRLPAAIGVSRYAPRLTDLSCLAIRMAVLNNEAAATSLVIAVLEKLQLDISARVAIVLLLDLVCVYEGGG